MANDKFSGYLPKKESDKGTPSKLDRVNPYEFKKGIYCELEYLGVPRLKEATLEQREKATETVLKNLDEHACYYSALEQFNTGMNQGSKIEEKSFKKYLESYTSERGEGMIEVDKEFKNDKMEEPKYDKALYTLKEAIKSEVKNILSEAKKDNEMSDEDKDKKASKGAKGKEKVLKALDKEADKLSKEKDKNKEKLSAPLQKYKDGKLTADEYKSLSAELVSKNKEINARLTAIEKEKDEITLSEKLGRREVAKTMMEKDTHMEILNIIKEAGVSLKEGAGGIKMYYEIAKTAYQEGFMAGLKK
tara:strand:+ start:134 stop:1045 length:912 start_codon:yes stop_codon:yes gene_type:complete